MKNNINDLIEKKIGNYYYYMDLENKKFIILNEIQKQNIEDINLIIRNKGSNFPFILFVGEDIYPKVDSLNDINFFLVKRHTVEFHYYLKGLKNPFRVAIKVNLNIEQFPVFINKVANLKAEVENIPLKKNYDMIIFSPSINRLELIQLRIHFSKSKILQGGSYIPENLNNLEEMQNYRLTDVVNRVGYDIISKNPVYAARFYLRMLDFKNMYELPLKIPCTTEEIQMILSFLDLMIENKNNIEDLRLNKNNLQKLKIYYEFIFYLTKKDFQTLENFYPENQHILKENEIKNYLVEYIKKIKEKYTNLTKEEEIYYWEIQSLLSL